MSDTQYGIDYLTIGSEVNLHFPYSVGLSVNLIDKLER